MQTYFAKSIFSSRTFWVNLALFLVAVLEETEVADLIPAALQGHMLAIAAVINTVLRFWSVRPVALITPGETRAVSVRSLPETGDTHA